VKRALLLTVLSLTLWSLQARVIFVKAGSTGNGSSWADAYGDLQQALKTARTNDEIWVAAGKYLPTKGTTRTIAFQIPDGVKVYGGFAGNETDLSARDWKTNRTILSGEIGSPSIDDNSFTVVLTKNVSAETTIDGFVITGGAANGMGAKGALGRCGAGWYNDGSNGESSPTIANCTFEKNYGRDGAGLYNYAQNGVANPTIQNCTFSYNRADLDGGAIHNDGNNGICSPTIMNCVFEQNEAAYGASILNAADRGEARPLITNCDFLKNISYISKESSIYNSKGDHGIGEAIVQNCRFADGSAAGEKQLSGVNADPTANNKQR